VHHAGTKVFDHDVHSGHQRADDLERFRLAKVQAQALLAPILLDEIAAAAVFDGWQQARRIGASSTLMMSAPISAISRVTVGPARYCVKSKTRHPDSIIESVRASAMAIISPSLLDVSAFRAMYHNGRPLWSSAPKRAATLDSAASLRLDRLSVTWSR
jgi:hypothetical protein